MSDSRTPPRHPAGDRLSPEEISRLPLLRWQGTVRLVESDVAVTAALEDLARETVLGFDIEVRPAFHKGQKYPPSLLQLAGEHAVWLFRLGAIRDVSGLHGLLSNPAVIKAGVALRDDLRKLRERHPVEELGFVELQALSTRAGIRENGVRGLAARVLGGRVDKRAKLANWAAPRLTPAQIDYAATDAWICRELYLKLRG